MTRVLTAGGEHGYLDYPATATNWYTLTGDGNYPWRSARTGSYFFEVGHNIQCVLYLPSSYNEGYFRFCFDTQVTGSNGNPVIWSLRNSAGTEHVGLWVGSDWKFHLNAGGTADVASSLNAVKYQSWNLVEIYFKIANSGGRYQMKLNGIQNSIDFTGDTQNGVTTTIDRIYDSENISYGQHAYDDIAFNDTTGDVDNSWCGDGHLEIKLPNANGDTNNWDGSDGNRTDNYLLVDEVPNDGDATYVMASGIGQTDMYNLASFTDTNKIITRIFPVAVARDISATGAKLKIGIKTGGNTYLPASGMALGSDYTAVKGTEYLINPVGSGIWNKTDIDALQFVVETP